jgi:pycsar effector protein
MRSPVGSSFSTHVAAASELAQAVGTAQNAATAGDPPMVGFGAGVHQHLRQLLTLIYSKTTTQLVVNIVLLSLLLSTRYSIKISLDFFYIGAIFFFSLSALLSTIVLFPRLSPHDATGLICWQNILLHGSPDKYYASIQTLDKAAVEEQYARDNYHLACTIRYKDALLRCAILLFILGMVFAVIGVVGPMAFSHH